MQSRTGVSYLLAVAALAVTGVCIAAKGASAGTITTVLFSTQQDFAGWTGVSNTAGTPPVTTTVSTVAVVSAPSEGGTTNGIGDPTPGSGGQLGTAGALQITLPNGVDSYYQSATFSQDLSSNTAVINALDSGGTITLDFIHPTVGTGYYFSTPALVLNYPNNFQALDGTASTTPDANGFYTDTMSLAGVPNIAAAEAASIAKNGYGYLSLGIIYNANVPAGSVATISNIAVTTTPEPASLAMLGVGGAALLLVGRRRRTA